MVIDTTRDRQKYVEFYEKIGRDYPESQIVHDDKSLKSLFGTVMLELKPFALSGKSLLDIGCNDGVYTIPYVSMGGRAHGIDISQSVISHAIERAKSLGLRRISFEVADIQKYHSLEKYDVVLMSEVLEHLITPDKSICNVKESLKPNGVLILTCPTPLFQIETFLSEVKLIFPTLIDYSSGNLMKII